MRSLLVKLLMTLVVMSWIAANQDSRAAEVCDAVGDINFLCIDGIPEDIVQVPETDWVIVSGKLRAINTKTLEDVTLFSTRQRFDEALYDRCPGPITGAEVEHEAFAASGGLNLRAGKNGIYTLYMMHRLGHGNSLRSSIEVFEVDFSGEKPGITWVGCMVHPTPAYFNSIAVLPNDRLAVTTYCCAEDGKTEGAALDALARQEITGEVWEWGPQNGWRIIPGTQGVGPNGIEASVDGKWLYVAEWAGRRIVRFSYTTDATKDASREVVASLDFLPDNLRWQSDGTLVTAGFSGDVETMFQQCDGERTDCWPRVTTVAAISPETGEIRTLRKALPMDQHFGLSTAATVVGEEAWVVALGHEGRIARMPLDSE